MGILATLPNPNLFTPLPTHKPWTSSPNPKPPIPIPKYPPAPLKTNTNYHKPITGNIVSSGSGDRSVIIGESGVSYLLPGAPFEFQFSYSETPKVKPIAIREPAFLPFAPPSMPRPWTGKAPMKNKVRKERKIRLYDSLDSNAKTLEVKRMMLQMGKEYRLGNFGGDIKPRNKVIGKPLTRAEIQELLEPHIKSNRQVNLGRDGLTHNMLELVHTHWKRKPVCKVRCLGVPTVDMDNVCRCLEDKTGGKIIHRVGGVIYIFRGRNYDPRTRPRYPVMLWKPATPVYPKLIQEAPEGLTKAEADKLRERGKNLRPICKLGKNGVYTSLVKDTRHAFEGSILVKIDCKGLDPSDYKRIGAKLKELVPCVLLSFDNEQILMWRGKDWKSIYPDAASASGPADNVTTNDPNSSESRATTDSKADHKAVTSSPKMMSLWKLALETNKALLLEQNAVTPDDLLEIVEEFAVLSQATEHSYPAVIYKNFDDDATTSQAEYESKDYSEGEYNSDDSDYDDEYYLSCGSYDEIDNSASLGSLSVDFIAKGSIQQL